mgnify:CR=1 FL=1|tara:strand:+ start:2918 stop:3352 length:435 start_codon:yes stop_codon:yes gene_type:complete
MARKATAGQKAQAKKYGVRTTKTVGGKRVMLDAETLKKRTATAKAKVAKKKVVAKKKAASKRTIGTSDRGADKRIAASTQAGQRKAKKYSNIKYYKKNPKTGKMEWVTVRRKNATSNNGKYITPTSGNKYTERRANRTDKGKFL